MRGFGKFVLCELKKSFDNWNELSTISRLNVYKTYNIAAQSDFIIRFIFINV